MSYLGILSSVQFMIHVMFASQLSNTDSYGGSVFSVAAPKLCNSILGDIKKAKTVAVDCFKTKQETLL